MMVDPVDYNTQEIYFHSSEHVDVISCLGEPLINTEGKMTIRVDLFDLLKDIDYFTKMVEISEKNRTQLIDKIEKGGEEDRDKISKD
jgi:hypothetical protein